MTTPTLKEPNIVADSDGPKLHNEILPTKPSQFDTVEFANKWRDALQTSISNRSDRHKKDTKELEDNPELKNDAEWMQRYNNHEERLDRELAASEIVDEYLRNM